MEYLKCVLFHLIFFEVLKNDEAIIIKPNVIK